MKLYLQKHTQRINDLKRLLKDDYDLHVPTSTSLANYCHTVRRQEFFKDFNNSLGSFQDLQNQYSIEKASNEASLIILGINEDLDNFTLVFSCQHYLQHFLRQQETGQPSLVCSDTTFSLMQNNYLLMVMGSSFPLTTLIALGTESPSHAFRFGCLAISIHENQESYTYFFNVVKQTLKHEYNFNLEPKFSMSDAHQGELNAFIEVFPEIIRLRCIFHLQQNIDNKVRSSKVTEKGGYVQWVTSRLREAMSKDEFESTWKLVKPELLEMTNAAFVEAYEKDYKNSEGLWFQGASFIGKQKTNNSLEAINRYLKDNWTERTSRTVPEFFELMKASFEYYIDKCKEGSCMPSEATNLKECFHKAEAIIEKNMIYHINESLYGFIRIPKKYKKNSETRALGLTK